MTGLAHSGSIFKPVIERSPKLKDVRENRADKLESRRQAKRRK